MIWCLNLELRQKKFMLTYDGVKKDKYNLEDEKDLNEENYEEPERFLLGDCMEDDQRIFPSDLRLELMVNSRQLGVDV